MNGVELAERVAAVRAFNRLYTRVIGVLDEEMVGTPFSLSEARVLFELAQREVTEVADLRRELGLDGGYASRLLGKLESRGLLRRDRSPEDARRQIAWLTEEGRAAQRSLEDRTQDQIGGLLRRLTEDDQQRLLRSMDTVSKLVGEQRRDPTLVLRPPRAGDLGWVVQRHGALYTEEYGWDARFEALVAKVAADFLEGRGNPRQAGWIAEVDGERVGSVFCMPGRDEKTAQLRLLIVEPSARGLGVGRRLVAECIEFARASGHSAVELWTISVLTAARKIYQRAGFQLVSQAPEHGFGPELTKQFWRLEL
ncbi:bifunctional helix-turn-helix transcriptional regulator/GNAT family N-acetyltransferase [Amycolatopsis anabasis]|uniref:bifunctional helix-turn-helix transcriptional regulator/GNAT family N-acetyltransferase n=1 Tax=Amycolatopsis anabasis TaxID=1840409 RepID=UPI00131C4D5F|nr:helix-turn-helix domain-containing GNAT family N-acetyltransferase [Amycolatopsis anabasis]